MTKAVVLHATGGPENFSWEDWDPGAPGPGEARVRQTFAGLNYVDTYLRSGLYPLAKMPAVLLRVRSSMSKSRFSWLLSVSGALPYASA